MHELRIYQLLPLRSMKFLFFSETKWLQTFTYKYPSHLPKIPDKLIFTINQYWNINKA